MKRELLFPLLLLGTLIMSCQKDPDTDKLDSNYLVLTNYDTGTDFSSIDSYFVIDSILIIDDHTKPTYWKNENSQKIVNAYSDNLNSRGYTMAATSDDADVVLQLSYINTTYYFTLEEAIAEAISINKPVVLAADLNNAEWYIYTGCYYTTSNCTRYNNISTGNRHAISSTTEAEVNFLVDYNCFFNCKVFHKSKLCNLFC